MSHLLAELKNVVNYTLVKQLTSLGVDGIITKRMLESSGNILHQLIKRKLLTPPRESTIR